MESLSIDVTHPRQDAATLHIKGFVYATTLTHLEETVQSVLALRRKNIIFDLTQTNYVSSGGWSAFLSTFHRAKQLGGTLLLAGMKPEIYDAFEMLGYDKILKLFSTPEEALRESLPQARPA